MKWLTLQQLKSSRPQMRKQAVARLVAEDGAKAVDHLLPFVNDPDPGVRKEVVQALGQTKDERALTALIHALRDADGDVREAVVVALTQLEDKRAIEPLTRALGDPRHEVRWRAARALDAQGWQPANDDQTILRAIAAGEFGKAASVGSAAVDRLAAALRDQRNPKRRMVVEALGQVGDVRAIKALVAAVKDPDPAVRVNAIDA
jgi:HEAT repeat protein